MGSFHLRDLKSTKLTERARTTTYFDHVVYGSDLSAIQKYFSLVQEYGEENVVLVSSINIDYQALKQKLFCDVYSNQDGKDYVFYKEGSYYSFDSKIKHQPLGTVEQFFIDQKCSLDFSHEKSEELFAIDFERLQEKTLVKIIASVATFNPEDLVERANFKLVMGSDEDITCEQLHWCEPQSLLYQLLEDKNLALDKFHLDPAHLKSSSALVICFELTNEIFDEGKVNFIAQSQTHEWGYFIVEEFTAQVEKRYLSCLIPWSEDEEVDTALMAKKVKLLKRVLKRFDSSFQKNVKEEFIRFNSYMITNDSTKSIS